MLKLTSGDIFPTCIFYLLILFRLFLVQNRGFLESKTVDVNQVIFNSILQFLYFLHRKKSIPNQAKKCDADDKREN